MKSLKNLNFEKIQNVGIRVDFNVPIDKNFKITDKTRLDRAKDTINFIKFLILSKTSFCMFVLFSSKANSYKSPKSFNWFKELL